MDAELQAALDANLPPGRTPTQQRIVERLNLCADTVPDRLWPQFWAFVVSVNCSKENAQPATLEEVRDYGDVCFIGQDPHVDDESGWLNEQQGLLGRRQALVVKAYMFMHAWGWPLSATEPYLLDTTVCSIDDIFQRKERARFPKAAYVHDMAQFLTRQVDRIWAAQKAGRTSRAICFGRGVQCALERAGRREDDKAIRPQDYVESRRDDDAETAWQVTLGLAVYILQVRRRTSKEVRPSATAPRSRSHTRPARPGSQRELHCPRAARPPGTPRRHPPTRPHPARPRSSCARAQSAHGCTPRARGCRRPSPTCSSTPPVSSWRARRAVS